MTLIYDDPSAASANAIELNATLASKCVVELGEGVLYVANTIQLGRSANKLRGQGQGATFLMNTSASGHAINVAGELAHIEVSGLSITRSVSASGAPAGINCAGTLYYPRIEKNHVYKHGIGVVLRGCGYGWFQQNAVEQNSNVGVFLTPNANYGALQWIVENNLSQLNGSHGYLVLSDTAVPGVGRLTMGDWINNRTYANTGHGMMFQGLPTQPIEAVRILGAFVGEDAQDVIWLDTYSGGHVVRGVYGEMGGQSPTGPTVSTPPSHASSGIVTSPNDTGIEITDCYFTGMSNHGVLTRSKSTLIDGVTCKNNGASGGVGYGFYIADGAQTTISGSTTKGNFTGTLVSAANPGSLAGAGNKFA